MIAVNLFHLRGGKIVDRREFFWEDLPDFIAELPEADTASELAAQPVAAFEPGAFFSALLKQLYIDQPYVPTSIYVPVDFADRAQLVASSPSTRNIAWRSPFPSAARSAPLSTSPRRTRSRATISASACCNPAARPSRKLFRTRSCWRTRPAPSSASTSPTSRARRPSPPWLCGKTAR